MMNKKLLKTDIDLQNRTIFNTKFAIFQSGRFQLERILRNFVMLNTFLTQSRLKTLKLQGEKTL